MINIDYVYNNFFVLLTQNSFNCIVKYNKDLKLNIKNNKLPDNSSEFYEGLGHDLI